MQTIVETLMAEWQAISNAPFSFIAAIVIVAGVVWNVRGWQYSATIEALQHRLVLKDDTIKSFEDRAKNEPRNERKSGILREGRSPLYGFPEDEESGEREIIALDESIASALAERTDLQISKATSHLHAKWTKVNGVVTHLSALSESMTSASLVISPHQHGLGRAYCVFHGDRDRLEVLRPNDAVEVIGRIRSISSGEIALENCELIKAG